MRNPPSLWFKFLMRLFQILNGGGFMNLKVGDKRMNYKQYQGEITRVLSNVPTEFHNFLMGVMYDITRYFDYGSPDELYKQDLFVLNEKVFELKEILDDTF